MIFSLDGMGFSRAKDEAADDAGLSKPHPSYKAGYLAAIDVDQINPFPDGSPDHAEWMRGFMAGTEDKAW